MLFFLFGGFFPFNSAPLLYYFFYSVGFFHLILPHFYAIFSIWWGFPLFCHQKRYYLLSSLNCLPLIIQSKSENPSDFQTVGYSSYKNDIKITQRRMQSLFSALFYIIFAALNYYYKFHNENSGKLSIPAFMLIVSLVTLIAIGTS